MNEQTLCGLSITHQVLHVSRAIWTENQLGGQGPVYNLPLVVPFHLPDSPVTSLEMVTVPGGASIGTHLQHTDEIYYIVGGTGQLLTNSILDEVTIGDLVIAPKGTRHSITNVADNPLSFFVVEVKAWEERPPTILKALPAHLQTGESFENQTTHPLRLTRLDLSPFFSGQWGSLTVLELPPGARLEPMQKGYDQNIFIPRGMATFSVEALSECLDTDGGLNAWIPSGVCCTICNQSSHDPLQIVLLSFPRTEDNDAAK